MFALWCHNEHIMRVVPTCQNFLKRGWCNSHKTFNSNLEMRPGSNNFWHCVCTRTSKYDTSTCFWRKMDSVSSKTWLFLMRVNCEALLWFHIVDLVNIADHTLRAYVYVWMCYYHSLSACLLSHKRLMAWKWSKMTINYHIQVIRM